MALNGWNPSKSAFLLDSLAGDDLIFLGGIGTLFLIRILLVFLNLIMNINKKSKNLHF